MPKCSGPLADNKGTSQSCLSTQNKNGRRRSRFKTRVYLKMRRETPPLYGQIALFKNGHHVILQKGTALAPPLVSLLGLGGKNCTARDKSPAAPDGAGDFPSSLRRVSESIDTGYLHFMVFPYNTPPGGGVSAGPLSLIVSVACMEEHLVCSGLSRHVTHPLPLAAAASLSSGSYCESF